VFDGFRGKVAKAAFRGPLRFVHPNALRIRYYGETLGWGWRWTRTFGFQTWDPESMSPEARATTARLLEWTSLVHDAGRRAHESGDSVVRRYMMATRLRVTHLYRQLTGPDQVWRSVVLRSATLLFLQTSTVWMIAQIAKAYMCPTPFMVFHCLLAIMMDLALIWRLVLLPAGW
jgi:hypothetical protein